MKHCFNPPPSVCATLKAGAASTNSRQHGSTILVIDASASLRRLVCIILMNSGYEVIEAASVAQALEQLDGREILMAICELHLPGINGIELAKVVRSYPAYQRMPILILATTTDGRLMEQARAAGARAWMVKPFMPTALLSAIHRLCATAAPAAAH